MTNSTISVDKAVANSNDAEPSTTVASQAPLSHSKPKYRLVQILRPVYEMVPEE